MWGRIFPTRILPIDDMLVPVDNGNMMGPSLNLKGMARAFFSSVVAGLFLFQILTFVISSGPPASLAGDAGASIALTGELCLGVTDNGGKPPAHPNHHHHCALCPTGHYDDSVEALADLAKVIGVLTPRSDAAPKRHIPDDLTPSPAGWTSSWSSRAPPAFS